MESRKNKIVLRFVIGLTIFLVLSMTVSADKNDTHNKNLINEYGIIRHLGSTYTMSVDAGHEGSTWSVKSTDGFKLISTGKRYNSVTKRKTIEYTFQAKRKGYQYIAQSFQRNGKVENVAFMKFLVI